MEIREQSCLKKRLEELKKSLDSLSELQCEKLLSIVENYFYEPLTTSELVYALQLCLHYGDGKISILKFLTSINALGKGKFVDCAETCFDLLMMLVKSYPEHLKTTYTQNIVNISLIFIRDVKIYAKVKEAAAKTILVVLETVPNEVDFSKIIVGAMGVFDQKDPPQGLRKQCFLILGLISKKFPKEMNGDLGAKVRQLMLSKIQILFKSDKSKAEMLPVAGAIEGLHHHLCNFTPKLIDDPDFGGKLYECMVWLTDPKKANEYGRRDTFRKMLALISDFANIHNIPSLFFRDYLEWQDTLTQWMDSESYEDKNAGVQAMQTFHEQIANELENRKNPDDKIVLKYFVDFFEKTLQHSESEPHRIRIAIRGFGAMSAACKILEEKSYIVKLFDLIIQQTEHCYSTHDRLKRREVLGHLPNYVQSLSKIMNQLDEISGIQLQSLQSIIVVLMKDFHYLSSAHHPLVPISLMETFLNLQKLGGKVLSDVLEFVTWQGILWTCSHQLTYDLRENIDDIRDWKEMITYKNYLPLWSQLINPMREDYKQIAKMIFNIFVKDLFEIINHLDLSTKKRTHSEEETENFYFSDPSLDIEPIRPENYQILYNIIQFYSDIFNELSAEFLEENFAEWLEFWLENAIKLSVKYPLVSGFLQILQLVATIMVKLSYTDEVLVRGTPIMMKNLESLSYFIKNDIFDRSIQYSGELQVSCLQLIFQLPTPILKTLIHEISPIFVIGFNIGRGFLPLAHHTLSCFERIVETLSDYQKTRRHIFEQVLPCLESYMSSQDTGDKEVKKMFRRGRKTKFTSHHTTSDTDLMRFKKRILWLLGNFDMDEAQLILSKFEPKLVRNHITNVFKVKLDTNEDSILQIFLDDSVSKICELSLTSSERSIRISACELLHGLAIYMIGKSLDGPDTLPIFSEICRSLIILGADRDETVRQLFEPLLKQIVHYFSKSDKILSPMTTILIESLMAMISCQSNSSVQDLSAVLLNEFLPWMNRQCDRSQRKSSPLNLVDLFHEMRKMSLETDASRRMGATMAFNNIYRIIREDNDIVDIYWIYLLEVFSTNFKNSEDFGVKFEANFVDGRRYEQISTAMDHIQRVFIERSSTFHASREKRIKPEGFDGKTLFDVLKWIFFEASQSEYFYRHKCMEMFLAIQPECGTKQEFFENHLTIDKVLSTGELRHEDLNFLRNTRKQIFKETSKWMNDLLRSIDFYVWILENDIIPKNLIAELFSRSRILNSMEFFLKEIVLKDLEGTFRSIDQTLMEVSEISMELQMINHNRDDIDILRSVILVRIIDFITISCHQPKVNEFLLKNQGILIEITQQLIFEPHVRGYDYKTKSTLLKLPKRIMKFTQKINQKSSNDFKEALMSHLKQKLLENLDSVFQNFDTIVAARTVSLVNINKLNGIELIVGNVQPNFSYISIEEGINIVTAENLIVRIFDSLVEKIEDVSRPKYVTPTVQFFMIKLMKLCFKVDNFIPMIINLVLNNVALNTSSTCQTHHGDYFLQVFKTTIIEHFITNLPLTVELLMDRFEACEGDAIKFKIISTLTELNVFLFQHHRQNEEILMRNLHQMQIYWQKIIMKYAEMNNEMNCVDLALVNLSTHMAMICPVDLHEFGKTLIDLEKWIINMLKDKTNSLGFKSKVVSLFPLITSIDDLKNERLTNILNEEILQRLPTKSIEFKEGSIKRANLVSIHKELFKALTISKSPIIFRFIVYLTISDDKYVLESDLQQVQSELMESLDEKGQETMLKTLFEEFSNKPAQLRTSFVSRFLQTLIKSANVDVMIGFFKSNIDTIWKWSEQPMDEQTSSVLVNRCVAFLIIEAFYASVPKVKIDSTDFIFKGQSMSGNKLTKEILKSAKNRRNDPFLVENREQKELFRKYQCCVYRALSTIVSNTQTDAGVYSLVLFECKIWEKMIDCSNVNVFGEFMQEFDEFPKIKEYITCIKDLKTGTESKRYNESVSIFDKSLSQSLTKNDLTYAVILSGREALLNDQLQIEKERQKTIHVRLESTPINDHEVMSVLVGVINHIFESKISPHQDLEKDENKNKFSWVKQIAESILTGKNNVKLFLIKLVDNCRDIFIHYAKYLFMPILMVITDEQLFKEMSFFYADAVTMLLSWSAVYKPDPSERVVKNKMEKVLSFLVKNHYHEKSEVFKLNLELIKKVCETWKEYLDDAPASFLQEALPIHQPELQHRLKCGIQLNAVMLFNGLVSWIDVIDFVEKLLYCLKLDDKNIIQPASQLLGMCLKHECENECFEQIIEKVIPRLQKIAKNEKEQDKFLKVLYMIQKSYPPILDSFLSSIKDAVPHAIKNIKLLCLEMYLSRLEVDGVEVYREIVSYLQIKDLLKQNEYQLLALFIINKSLDFLNLNQTMEFVKEIRDLFKSPREEVRKFIVEILINICEKFKDDSSFQRKDLYGILLKGFTDNDIEVHNRVMNFFYNESALPMQLIPRFLMILNDLYFPDLEKDFLHYSTLLLIDVAIRNPRSKEKLLDFDPTRDRNYIEFKIPTKATVQQSLAPMFIPSQTRSRSMMILATQENESMMFAPTQDPVLSSQSSQTFEFKETANSLLFELKPQFLDKNSNFVANNEDNRNSNMSALDSLRRRIVKQSGEETSRKFALRAVDKRSFLIDQRKEKLKRLREGREVQLYRRYRQGDYPDFFFTTLSILLPLKALVRKDPAIARDIFINIFQSILAMIKNDGNEAEEKLFFDSINQSVMKILKNTKQTDTFLIATLLEMTIKSEKYLEISPDVLANVVTTNNLIVGGIVFLEHQLKFLISNKIESEHQSKRRRLQENTNDNETTKHWLKMLDLFYRINEYEIIQGIFTEKLNLEPQVRDSLTKAIDFESNSQFKDASEIYKELLDLNAPRNYTEEEVMLQSYYNCLENLTDWKEISESIARRVTSYNHIWDEAVPCHREVLLPHLLKSEVRIILNNKANATSFCKILEEWLTDETKTNYLRENFPEEIVMLNIIETQFNEGFVEVERALRNCADEWSCLERIDEKIICLKDSRILAELNNFTYLMTVNPERREMLLNRMYRNWKTSKAKPADSLVQWRDLISYRREFLRIINHNENNTTEHSFSTTEVEKFLSDIQHSLLDVAFKQKNCDAVEYLMEGLHNEHRDFAKSKLILMKAEQRTLSTHEKFNLLRKGLMTVDKLLEKNVLKRSPDLYVEGCECASEISWKLCELYKTNDDLEAVTAQLMNLVTPESSTNIPLTDSILDYCESRLKTARNIADKILKKKFSVENELLFAESCLKLGKFYQQAFNSGFNISGQIQEKILMSIFKSIAYGSSDAKMFIPFILNLPELMNGNLSGKFNESLSMVPTWMFIPFISQMLSNYDFENECYLDVLLLKIARKFPNALFFPFKLSLMNYHDLSEGSGMVKPNTNEIAEIISNKMLDKFVEALECVVVPEKLFLYELTKFSKKIKNEMSNSEFREEIETFSFEAFEKNLEMKGSEFEKLQKLKREVNVIKEHNWETERDKIKSDLRSIQQKVEKLAKKPMRMIDTAKLSKFFENYKWNGGNDFLEIPGQYSGDEQPMIEKHVKIVRFGDKMKIYQSKQLPIELKIHGSDGKVYSFIVKYGEDLRQDQRIQQVLQLMSKKLLLDKNCKKNRLEIQTYNVIPINSNCGIMSVVNNAITLTEFLDDACSLVIGKTYSSMDGQIRGEFKSFLATDLTKSCSSVEIYRNAVKNLSRQQLVEELMRQEKKINLDIFQQWIMHVSLSFEANYTLRKNLITSLSTMNVAHFILGVGDRHLGNTLINKTNGTLIGIDFGISFNAGTQLDIPELVPCRLTSHFVNVIEPLGIEGIVRRNMIHAIRCLRSHKETIMICLEMFIKEPTMDWLVRSKSTSHQLVWNPEQRIDTVKKKLDGANPMKITIDELSLSSITSDVQLHQCYNALIRGDANNKRNQVGDINLSPEDQISAIIDMATDKALLSVIWLGWDPWI